jgi:hypothetical protein
MLIDHDHPPGPVRRWALLGLRPPGGAYWTTTTASRTRKLTSARPGEWAWAAHRYAVWALGSSGIAVLAATAALVTR